MKYEHGTSDYYDFEMMKAKIVCDALEAYAVQHIKAVNVIAMAAVISDADKHFQNIISATLKSVEEHAEHGTISELHAIAEIKK